MTLLKENQESLPTGRMGDLVVASRFGKRYLRRAQRRTGDSWTPAQVLHRQRFSRAIAFTNQFKYTLIPQIWIPAAERMSGYGLMLKTNMPAFGPDGTLMDPKLISLSVGKLPLPMNIQASRTAEDPGRVQVSWLKSSPWGGISLRDELLVISETGGQYSELKATGLVRGLLGGTFELPATPQVKASMHIYLFFASADRRNYSQSVCVEV